jgi:DNA-binding Xre family transcriptional regulator
MIDKSAVAVHKFDVTRAGERVIVKQCDVTWNLQEIIYEGRKRNMLWLSNCTGIDQGQIHRLVKGRVVRVGLVTLGRLCVALDCSPSDLIIVRERGKE